MENLRNQIIGSINERYEELVQISKDVVESYEKDSEVIRLSSLQSMEGLTKDITDLHLMIGELNGASELEEMDDYEIQEYIAERINTHKWKASHQYKNFIEERSYE
ncbi:hypothetical protein ACTQ54_03200 [Fundicoccus sp. Sow4_H7]|uniref:hypothetical protein n=1 Tax=Fundicoccus sp. Sow4_H7 TaxID=3438784 RepID=UPI003F90B49B